MPALVAGIHAATLARAQKAWMAGTSPAMTGGEASLASAGFSGLHALRRARQASTVRGDFGGAGRLRPRWLSVCRHRAIQPPSTGSTVPVT